MKKWIFLLVAFFLFLIPSALAQGEQIQDFNVRIDIQKDGTIQVEESAFYDFDDLERHGIYRNIPYIKENTEGKKFELKLNVQSVEDGRGKPYRFTTSKNTGVFQIKIGDPDKTITGKHLYVITYTVSGALSYFSDHDELYWNVTGNEWTVPIVNARAEITFPEQIDGPQLKLACYTGPLGSTAADCSFQTSTNSVIFRVNRQLSLNEGLTIVAGFPKNTVAVLEPREFVPFGETWYGRLFYGSLLLILFAAALFWYVVYPIWIIIKWWRFGRDPSPPSSGPKGPVSAWFDSPKTKGGRALVPAEVGALVDETVHQKDISAMIVDLARRGYLKIEERKKKDFYFVKRKAYGANKQLLSMEKELLDILFKSGSELRLKGQHLYSEIEKVKGEIYESLVGDGFFPRNPNSIRTFYYVMGVFALMTFNIPLVLIAFIFGSHMPRKTEFGVQAAYIAKSLKNFLSSQERQLEFQSQNLPAGRHGQMFFEKLLPFAVAFGVEKIWAERFKDIAMKEPDWYAGPPAGGGTTRFNSVVFADSLDRSFTSMASAATPTRSSSGFSSGFSGGSSGGGGGGGGGGSW